MKATGIVRRVDDLGRVVIPREIRKSMGIQDGEPLEIFTESDAVIFRRYCYNLTAEVARVAELVEQNCNADAETMHWLTNEFMKIYEVLKESEKGEEE